MLKKAFVPIVMLALAGAFCAGEAGLQHRLGSAHRAQLTLVHFENQLNQLQGLPWQVENPRFGTPKFIRGLIAGDEQKLLANLRSLRSTNPSDTLGAIDAPLQRNFTSLDGIFELGLKPGGWNDPRTTGVVTQMQNTSVDKTTAALGAAERDYAARAARAERWAVVGGILGTLALFAAFLFFYLRAEATSRRQRRTLDALERSQAERRRLLERTVEVAEHERIRLAMDLHDGPIQHLTALAFNIDRLGRRVSRDDLEGAQALVEDVRTSLSGEMQALRQLMVELRPPILDEGGLAAALGDAAARVLGGTSTAWGVTCDVDDHLAPELETVVYRVANEALVNVRKHAEASRVDVVVTRSNDGHLSVAIADDGVGFDPNCVEGKPDGKHYGLLGMHERVGGLGGTCTVDSRPGLGTSVRATLPLKARAQEEVAGRDLVAA
jgi:signal transduction histidine kinase